MALASHLLDTSVLHRMKAASVAAVVEPLLERGLLATCGILDLEALYSTRSPQEYASVSDWRRNIFEYVETEERDLVRGQEVQAALAKRSMTRAVGLADLLIAAIAERHGITVLHYDRDFDVIAGITGQPMQWVVTAGTVS